MKKINVIWHSFLPVSCRKKGSSKKAARKKMKAYQKMTEKMTLLEMPVVVDRSKDEKGKDAKKNGKKSIR